jgi:RNA polymerase sigma-70 factor (ECF subfamily)
LDIERCLARLPRDQARAIALFYLTGLSIDQISSQLEAPAGTVKYWLHQGRRRLAEFENLARLIFQRGARPHGRV